MTGRSLDFAGTRAHVVDRPESEAPEPTPLRPPAPEPPDPDAPAEQGQVIMFNVPLPSGRMAVIGLPAGCAPGEALYVVSQINELAGAAYRAAPEAHPGGRPKPRLWVPT